MVVTHITTIITNPSPLASDNLRETPKSGQTPIMSDRTILLINIEDIKRDKKD
jgi:hypothetical protein